MALNYYCKLCNSTGIGAYHKIYDVVVSRNSIFVLISKLRCAVNIVSNFPFLPNRCPQILMPSQVPYKWTQFPTFLSSCLCIPPILCMSTYKLHLVIIKISQLLPPARCVSAFGPLILFPFILQHGNLENMMR